MVSPVVKVFRLLILGISLSVGHLWADWSAPVDIYSNQSTMNPAVAMDADGNAVLIASASADASTYFTQIGQLVQGSVSNLQSFSPATISSNQGSNNVAVASSGDAVAAWQEWGNKTNFSFLMAAMLINNSWSIPFPISDSATLDAINFIPGVNIDSSSNALVVWGAVDITDNNYHIQSNLYSSGAWQGINDIYSTSDILSAPTLSGNASGQALAVWCEGCMLQAGVFDGTNWDVNLNLSSDVIDVTQPLVAVSMNAAGNAIILWNDASHGGLSSISYSQGQFGGQLFPYIPPTGQIIQDIAINLDETGNAVAAWIAQSTDGSCFLFVNHYLNGRWKGAQLLDSVIGSSLKKGNISIRVTNASSDTNGNTVVVFQKTDSSGNGIIYSNVFNSKTMEWGQNQALSSNQVSASRPFLAISPSGAATVVWNCDYPGGQKVQAAYTSSLIPPLLPPQRFSGKQVKNRFATQTDIVNILSWTPSSDPTAISYYLFRNNKLLAIIPASSLSTYQDHNRVSKKRYTYKLTAVNAGGQQSPALKVTLP